jgi:glycerol-3-phosphate dehydrogenase
MLGATKHLRYVPRLLPVAASRHGFATVAEPAPYSLAKKAMMGVAAAGVVGYGAVKVSKSRHDSHVKELIKNSDEGAWSTRDENMKRLKAGKEFDMLVIGGGATGCGVALDAQTRGLNVALVEKEDFASGTSSRSTKLIWAGSRYLVLALVNLFGPALLPPNTMKAIDDFIGSFKMVCNCHRERRTLVELNPHLIRWLPICVPLDRWFLWPPPFGYYPAIIGPFGMFPAFFKFYDFLGSFCSPNSYMMGAAQAQEEFPQLAARPDHTMKYVLVFYEAQHNDARTNLAIGLTAAKKGACMSNYTEVVEVLFGKDGKATGAKIKDSNSGEVFDVHAKSLVFAGGPYTDNLRKMSEGEEMKKCVRGATGTHIVLPGYFTPKDMGFVDMSTSDGRFLFVLNWLGHTLVGTTDNAIEEVNLHQKGSEDEIDWILNEARKYLHNSANLNRSHVLSAWQGTRPLVKDPNADASNTSGASRDHTISRHEGTGISFISGGKWTTYREMAEDTVDHVLVHYPALKEKAGPCKTEEMPLIGAGATAKAPEGWHRNLKLELCSQYGMGIDVAESMANTYGTRVHEVMECAKDVKGAKKDALGNVDYGRLAAGYPYIEAEIRYAVRKEYACTAYDVLARRTRLAFLNIQAAKAALPRVIAVMGEELGWSASRRNQELAAATKVLDCNFDGPTPVIEMSGQTVEGVMLSSEHQEEKASGLAFG